MAVFRRTISHMYFLSGTKVDAKIGFLVLSIVIVVLWSRSANAQSVDPVPLEAHRPQVSMPVSVPVKKLCGRLQRVQKGVFVTVPKTKLKLYEAKSWKSCCEDSKLIGSRTSAANGDFDFGDVQTGRYWLEVEWDGRENIIAIDLDPRHDWQGSCEFQGVLIEEKSLTWIAGQAEM
jgi:hypothetical protein